MAKYITQHRRGTTQQWEKSDVVVCDGEIVVEYCDDGKIRLKIGNGLSKFSELPYMHIPGYATEQYVDDKLVTQVVTRTRTVSMLKDAWVGTFSPYTQEVVIDGVTAASKIDLQPTPSQLAQMSEDETTLVAENNGGVVTIYAIGEKPTVDYIMQATITEVIT